MQRYITKQAFCKKNPKIISAHAGAAIAYAPGLRYFCDAKTFEKNANTINNPHHHAHNISHAIAEQTHSSATSGR
jgi:hypothetical protein